MKSSASKHNEVWLGFCGLKLNLPLLPCMNIFALNNFYIWIFAGKYFKEVSETVGFGWRTSCIKRFWFLPPPALVTASFSWHQHCPCLWFGPRSERKALREKIFGTKYSSRWLLVIFSSVLSFWGSQGCTGHERIAAFWHTQKKKHNSFSHFSKFYLDSPARSCFKRGICSEPGALSTAQPPFPSPFIPTRQPAALQGQRDELLRGEAAEHHEAPSQARGAGGLCSASALCEVQIEVAMCAAWAMWCCLCRLILLHQEALI